jgi:hypothetical protein
MKCTKCDAALEADEVRCGTCNAVVAESAADLQKTDPIAWLVIGLSFATLGTLGVIFVYLNRNMPTFAGSDYYSGLALALFGLGLTGYALARRRRGK